MAKSKKDPNFPMQGKGGAMGGKYATKSTNLSKKTLKAAGAAKAAKKRTVDISQTRREGSRTVGPGGKALTGTVTLQDGSKAVYKNGRRVQAADARKPKAATTRSRPGNTGGSSGGSAGGSGGGTSSDPPKVGTIRKGAAGNKYNRWDGKKWVPVAAARTAGPSRPRRSTAQIIADTKPASNGGKSAAAKSATSGTVSSAVANSKPGDKAKPAAVKNQPGIADDVRRAVSSWGTSSGPKIGDTRKAGGPWSGKRERWDGKKWVPVRG